MEAQSDDPRSRDARVKASLECIDVIRAALSAQLAAPPRNRAGIRNVLEACRSEIMALHDRGDSLYSIAATLRLSGARFSEGSLRNAVRHMLHSVPTPNGALTRRALRRAPASASAPPAAPEAPVVKPLLSVTPAVKPVLPAPTARPARPEPGNLKPAPTNTIDRLNEEL